MSEPDAPKDAAPTRAGQGTGAEPSTSASAPSGDTPIALGETPLRETLEPLDGKPEVLPVTADAPSPVAAIAAADAPTPTTAPTPHATATASAPTTTTASSPTTTTASSPTTEASAPPGATTTTAAASPPSNATASPAATTPADASAPSGAASPSRSGATSSEPAADALSASPYALARKWTDEGADSATIVQRLLAHGTSEEDAKLLLHSLAGDDRAQAPELTVEPTINPLAPTSFSVADLGFSGPRHIVGLYWLTFGGLTAGLMALLQVLWEAELMDPATETAIVLSRMAGIGGAVALAYGGLLVASSVRVRRK